jgi:hypothetical protein
MNKLLIAFVFGIMLISLVSAGEAGEFIGYAKQGNCFTLKQSCADCTYVNISAVIDSSGNTTTNNTAMQKIGGFYNYSQCGNLVNGRVDVIGIFNPDGINQTFNYYYEVNPTGESFGIAQAIIFLILLGILILFMIAGFSSIFKSSGAWQIAYICLAYISLFGIFFFCWEFSSNYLWSSSALASIFWILWLVLAFGFLPFIIGISVYIIGKGVKDNLYKEFVGQGHSPEEAREMAKRGKR